MGVKPKQIALYTSEKITPVPWPADTTAANRKPPANFLLSSLPLGTKTVRKLKQDKNELMGDEAPRGHICAAKGTPDVRLQAPRPQEHLLLLFS